MAVQKGNAVCVRVCPQKVNVKGCTSPKKKTGKKCWTHSMARANLNKSENTTAASKYIPK